MPQRSRSSVRVFYPVDRAAVLDALRRGVERLDAALPLRKVVLFGSYGRGTHTVASDVDVLVVYRGQPRADAYAQAKRLLGVRGVEPHVYAEGEDRASAALLERMTAGGVVLLSRAA
ncbi:MAG: nucleotidyltransferase family protein [Candidatus Rokuibacteriota bacterium]